MTEPDAGTDVANYKTNVDRVGNKLRLNGVKTLISRADEAGMFVVFTRVDKKPGREGIGCVLVEKGTPGFSVTGTYHTMGGENLHEIRFEDVELPPENLVLGGRLPQIARRLQHAALPQPEHLAGPRRGRLRRGGEIRQGAPARSAAPIADFQGMRWKLAEMYRDIEASRSILYRACASADPFPDPLLAAAAKITVNEMALRVTSEAIQVHGGYGFTDEFPVSRFYRGARYGTLGGGTTETLKDLIGRRVLAGIDPVDGILGLVFLGKFSPTLFEQSCGAGEVMPGDVVICRRNAPTSRILPQMTFPLSQDRTRPRMARRSLEPDGSGGLSWRLDRCKDNLVMQNFYQTAMESSPANFQKSGKSFPLGATVSAEGTNFSIFSKHSTEVQLLIFEHADDPEPAQ